VKIAEKKRTPRFKNTEKKGLEKIPPDLPFHQNQSDRTLCLKGSPAVKHSKRGMNF